MGLVLEGEGVHLYMCGGGGGAPVLEGGGSYDA